jgi:hypothetical protein
VSVAVACDFVGIRMGSDSESAVEIYADRNEFGAEAARQMHRWLHGSERAEAREEGRRGGGEE